MKQISDDQVHFKEKSHTEVLQSSRNDDPRSLITNRQTDKQTKRTIQDVVEEVKLQQKLSIAWQLYNLVAYSLNRLFDTIVLSHYFAVTLEWIA